MNEKSTNRVSLLRRFIKLCDDNNLTPNDKHIKDYLSSRLSLDLVPLFIKFCFYHWENRLQFNDFESFNNALKELE